MHMTDVAAIDRGVLNQLLDSFGGDMEFLGEMLDTFFEDSPRQLEAARAGLAAGDAEAVRRAAHSLKSNSASFGAMPLSRMSKVLEDMGKAGTLDGAGEGVAAAEAEYARVKAALETATA